MFDPNETPEAPSFEALNQGPYLLGMTQFTRKTAEKSGKTFLWCRWEVCGGPSKGKSFFARMYLNPEAWARLKSYCVGIGYDMKPFDLNRDRDLARVFIGKPFYAQVKHEKKRGNDGKMYENNEIAWWIKDPWNDAMRAAAELWVSKFREKYDPSKYEKNADDSSLGDDGWGAGGGGGRESNVRGGDDFGAFADDDIPF